MRQEKADASNAVMGPMPHRAASNACQDSSVLRPRGVSKPTPVTTTLRDNPILLGGKPPRRLLFGGLVFDVVDGVLDGDDFFGVFVGDFELESLLKGHHKFHDIKRIGAQVVHEGGVQVHLAFIHAKLLDNNLLHLLLNGHDSSWDF